MTKSPDAFRTISEVADWLGIQAHVLRFWESKFSQIKPVKRAGGRRYYRPSDMLLLGGIKKLLHDDGMTIKGVQKLLREQGIGHVSEFSQSLDGSDDVIEGTAEPVDTDDTVVSLHPVEPQPTEQMPLNLEQSTPDAPQEVATRLTAVDEPETSDPEIDDAVAAVLGLKPEPVSQVPDEAESTEPAAAGPESSVQSEIAILEQVAAETSGDEPKAAIVEAPDPPEESQIIAAPGVLTALAEITGLTADQAVKLTPVAEELARWLDRQKTMAAT